MAAYQRDMVDFFMHSASDNPTQSSTRNAYYNLFIVLDGITTVSGAEKSVAKRKLLESMDAAMRAADQ